ncbi:acyl-CoA thioesterase [Oceanibacterium hippocampi]|uniref:Acyl-CoA thioester hydrolase YbgC n=1 Tax=Oceanibacterium hippocampi TaxID=745714 RepID=A0A1Y5TUT3_9PROT|nr:thioesterase family protein [Oceanibacterium hippocampi]SLN73542.1 Acyl-CoA thioester hydrolase YbgC [Oceanibacterium hippocampi]
MSRSDYRFSFPLRVRYSEIDGQGVVFNAHYLTYYDTAITEYLRALGFSYQTMPEETGTDFHLVRSLVEYKAPIRFDDEIDCCCRTGRIGRSSIQFLLGVYPKGGETLLATGEIVWVNTDQTTRKTVPVPAGLVRRIEAFEQRALQDG